ncbi:Hypothetical predicted protein [Pelobates cultripes]|uniref:Uncharacterized protein n=1 Tax=Pelobates cultripes TaxID=61616 RepID=A0AAD1WNH7_PELCU|nr:Hypothetical predicted protein [Pelobates cultripes]
MRQGPQHGSTRGERAHPRNPTRKKGNPVTWNCTKATHSPHKTTETQETLKAQLQRRPYRCAETRPKLQRGPDWTRGQQKEKHKMAAMKLPYQEGNDSRPHQKICNTAKTLRCLQGEPALYRGALTHHTT